MQSVIGRRPHRIHPAGGHLNFAAEKIPIQFFYETLHVRAQFLFELREVRRCDLQIAHG